MYESPDDWEGPNQAYRLGITWDDTQRDLHARLAEFVEQKGVGQLQALVIGAWMGDDSMYGSAQIIKDIVNQRDKLRGLRAIFLGDIIVEENEISWIEQSDASPLLAAYPPLSTRTRVEVATRFRPTLRVAGHERWLFINLEIRRM